MKQTGILGLEFDPEKELTELEEIEILTSQILRKLHIRK